MQCVLSEEEDMKMWLTADVVSASFADYVVRSCKTKTNKL